MGTSFEDTQKKIDKALKRNLEAQKVKYEKKNEIQPTENDIQGHIEENQIETDTDSIG